MLKIKPVRIATILAAACLLGASPLAHAQNAAPDQSASDTQSGAQSDAPSDAQPDSQAEAPKFSVLSITSVEMIRSSHKPAFDILRVSAVTSSDGWSDPELLPLSQGLPPDGILNLVFVAHAPAEAAEPTGFEPIEVIFPIDSGHPPYKGIRVYGATNSILLSSMPGYAESNAKLKDCGTCISKYYVPNGGSAPAGVAATDIVRQQDLPMNLRIIKPSGGISITDTDPNRLTLILGDNGQIVDAAWN